MQKGSRSLQIVCLALILAGIVAAGALYTAWWPLFWYITSFRAHPVYQGAANRLRLHSAANHTVDRSSAPKIRLDQAVKRESQRRAANTSDSVQATVQFDQLREASDAQQGNDDGSISDADSTVADSAVKADARGSDSGGGSPRTDATAGPTDHASLPAGSNATSSSNDNASAAVADADTNSTSSTADSGIGSDASLPAQANSTTVGAHGVARNPQYWQRQPLEDEKAEAMDADAHLLDADAMHDIADTDGYIMVTWANDHYFDFVQNWVEHVEALNISSFVVGAMDTQILTKLWQEGIPTFNMQSNLTANDYGWGSKNFHAMVWPNTAARVTRCYGRKKIKLVQLFTEMNLTVIISDVDTVWMRSPFAYFKAYPDADILTSSDYLRSTHKDEGLEDPMRAQAAFNIGIMMFAPRARAFAAEWVAKIEADDKIWDQNAFNELVNQGRQMPAESDPLFAQRLFRGARGTLAVGILPVSLFASGHTFFVSRLHEQLGLSPYVVHATFMFSGTPGKRNRFREFQLWNDPPEYYNPSYAFVTWDMDAPEALRAAAAPPTPPDIECCNAQQGHFDLALGTGIIVPQFWAGFDRWWAPHKGRLPGADATLLPYRAPLDHVVDLERGLGTQKDENEFGPNVPYREHSFLQNPRTPDAVGSSVVHVTQCVASAGGGYAQECATGEAPAQVQDGTVWLAPGMTDAQLHRALAELPKSYSVLHFESMNGTFSHFEDEQDSELFARRVRLLSTVWCCVNPPEGTPGHVWYDAQWDIVPHRDVHNKEWRHEWNITLGP